MKQTDLDLQQRRAAAEKAVAAVEAAPLDQDLPELRHPQHPAILELAYEAERVILPDSIPEVPAGAVDLFELAASEFSSQEWLDRVIDLHVRSIDTFPGLAKLLRSPVIWLRAMSIAEMVAPTRGLDRREFALAERSRYAEEIAGHLRGRKEFEPAASIRADVVPDLRAREAAVRARRRQHVADDLARIERENAEAKLIAAERLQARVDAAIAFFTGRWQLVHYYRNEQFTGAEIARSLQGVGLVAGEANKITIDDLDGIERLRRQVEAAEAVA